MKKVTAPSSTDKIASEGDRVFFSVIIPMYNRATMIRRCLDSALSQDFKDYELIIVDDGSEDDSVAVVEGYLPNPHLKLLRNQQNRGVCAARGLGVRHARGRWLMFIDSDDIFHPGAFETIYSEVSSVPQEVGEVRFCYWVEYINHITPIPLMPEGIIDFTEYLRWLQVVERSDLLYCQRKEIYDVLSWPTDRQYETLFHLQVAEKFKMMMSRKVIGTMYNDAPNRVTSEAENTFDAKSLCISRDNAEAKAKILRDYGEQMKKYCPRFYRLTVRVTGNHYMRCGKRLNGVRYLLRYLIMQPWNVTAWGLLLLGLIGPKALYWARVRFKK